MREDHSIRGQIIHSSSSSLKSPLSPYISTSVSGVIPYSSHSMRSSLEQPHHHHRHHHHHHSIPPHVPSHAQYRPFYSQHTSQQQQQLYHPHRNNSDNNSSSNGHGYSTLQNESYDSYKRKEIKKKTKNCDINGNDEIMKEKEQEKEVIGINTSTGSSIGIGFVSKTDFSVDYTEEQEEAEEKAEVGMGNPIQYRLIQLKPKRKRASPAQLHVLNQVFAETYFPSTGMRLRLAKELGMSPRAVQIWFQNRRQNLKGRKSDYSSGSDKSIERDRNSVGESKDHVIGSNHHHHHHPPSHHDDKSKSIGSQLSSLSSSTDTIMKGTSNVVSVIPVSSESSSAHASPLSSPPTSPCTIPFSQPQIHSSDYFPQQQQQQLIQQKDNILPTLSKILSTTITTTLGMGNEKDDVIMVENQNYTNDDGHSSHFSSSSNQDLYFQSQEHQHDPHHHNQALLSPPTSPATPECMTEIKNESVHDLNSSSSSSTSSNAFITTSTATGILTSVSSSVSSTTITSENNERSVSKLLPNDHVALMVYV